MRKKLFMVLKYLGLGIALSATVFLATNWDYFFQNAKYQFFAPTPVAITPVVNTAPLDVVVPVPATITPSTPSGPKKPAPNLSHDPAGTLIIQSLGVKAPVMRIYDVSEIAFQSALIDGVVHYPGTAEPGQVGNDYIFGHSSDYLWSKGHYKSVFALLPKIKIGDIVYVSDADGKFYTYKVVSTKIVLPTDTSVLQQNTNGKKILSVQTSYPVGTALKRFVAICEIVE